MMPSLKTCPHCGKRPKLTGTKVRNGDGYPLVGYLFECRRWWGRLCFGMPSFCWNSKEWADFALYRARDQWNTLVDLYNIKY